MKILVSQPYHEDHLQSLQTVLRSTHDFSAVLFPEGYLRNPESVQEASSLAKASGKMIITGYKDRNHKDRTLMIDQTGNVLLDRAKTPWEQPLYQPSVIKHDHFAVGYLLCVELLQGLSGLAYWEGAIDFIAHPIGVGMFSEEQFHEWIEEAKQIANKYNSIIIGASHADRSYRNCGISTPISYCINRNGVPVYIAKNDLRSWTIDTKTLEYEIIE